MRIQGLGLQALGSWLSYLDVYRRQDIPLLQGSHLLIYVLKNPMTPDALPASAMGA